MWGKGADAIPRPDARDRARLEKKLLALQSAIATFFCVGALSGAFGADGPVRDWIVAWIAGYHVAHAVYVLARRCPGRPIAWVETVTPLCDVTAITFGWVLLGASSNPFWAVYLYAFVDYAQRYEGRQYQLLAVFILSNLVGGHTLISLTTGSPMISSGVLTMVVLAIATAALSGTVGEGWRRAERRARQMAEIDPLTGIANRRTFLERLDELSQSPSGVFSVLMLDLDDFKRLNDDFGHLHGDSVLERVAQVLSDSVREGDRLARYGGEEFAVAMPGANLSEAVAVAERLREAIFEGTPTTVSIGCATRGPGETATEVLHRADDLLISAKRTGKNVVRSRQLSKSA